MTSARWELVARIFEAALEQSPSARQDFIRQACNADAELEAEVIQLLRADGEVGSFLERPLLSTCLPRSAPFSTLPLLSIGSVVSGRFEILRFIGQGGMGQVYEALDLELKERIALKAIRPEIAGDPHMLSRFRREVLLTRRITHPNVCRTFDIERHISAPGGGSESDITFLTMELLEGETLADLLRRRGRLTTVEATPLVLQMIAALAAAHSVGIIHRDFKPSNVLLVRSQSGPSLGSPSPSGFRVVVTDFGLARAILPDQQASTEKAATTLTGGHGLMGTLVYMAPEQFERGEATVASDIYALGLVMYEMVTGQRPFADPIPFAEAAKRLKQPAPSARKLLPGLNAGWEAAIGKCLRTEPENRFHTVQSVGDALAEPEHSLGPRVRLGSQAVGAFEPPLRSRGGLKRMKLVAACSVLLLLSLFGVLLRYYLRKPTPIQFAERDWILVTDFTNQTGEKVFDRVVRDLVVESLSQSRYVNIVPRLTALEAAKRTGLKDVGSIDGKLGRELCLRENYKALLTGDIFRTGSRYVIAMKVEVPGEEASGISESESIQSPDELFAGLDRLTARIRQALGESLSKIESNTRPLAQVTTMSLEALQRYSTALDLYAQGEYARCIALANDAVERDPGFAMAYLLLGQAYEQLGDEANSRNHLEMARARLDRVSERERHLILAVNYSNELLNEKAAEEYQHLLDISPDDVDALKGFANEAFWAGRTEQSIAAQRRATALSPGDVDCYTDLMTLLLRTSRSREALEVYNQARSRHLAAPNLKRLFALATWETGDLTHAREILDALGNEGRRWKVESTLYVGKLLAFQGRVRESIEFFRAGLALVQAPGLENWVPTFQYQITRAEMLKGDTMAARTESYKLREAVKKVPIPTNLQRGGRLSILAGDLRSAKHLEALARRQVATYPDAFSQMRLHNLAGDVALASGHASQAIQEQRSALTFRRWYTPYFSLGEGCEAAGDWQCAIEAYSRYLDFEGDILRDDAAEDWVVAHYSLARVYLKSGDQSSGDAYYQKFISFFSTADSDMPILSQARQEMVRLREIHVGKPEER